jgi:uncharacterized metal-binding protein
LFFNYSWCNVVDPDLDQISLGSQEGRALRGTKRFGCFVGFFGALWVSYWFMYAFFIGLVGGHRSVFSHGVVIGTIGRMIYFNVPIFLFFVGVGDIGKAYFQWANTLHNLYLEVWLLPYVITQLTAWLIADQIHLTLDLVWVEKMLGTYGKNNRKQY